MKRKYRSIILHVGLNKTGSTSIQNNSQNRYHDLLLDNGIKYASFSWAGKFHPNHGGPVTAALFDNADRYSGEWRVGFGQSAGAAQQAYREQFEQMLTSPEADTLLLSGESFSLYNKEDLVLLRDRLLPHTEQLRVLVFFRNPLKFVASIFQQRVRSGRVGSPERLAGVQQFRYKRLRKVFGGSLEPLNFDQFVKSPLGLVGAFFEVCGVSPEQLSDLDYDNLNQGISVEGFRVMRAINQRYPVEDSQSFDHIRKPRDLQPLLALPGARYGAQEFLGTPLYDRAEKDRVWFKKHLGLEFDDVSARAPEEVWSFATQAALEPLIRSLQEPLFQQAAADFLADEAARLADSESDKAAVLRFISRRLSDCDEPALAATLRDIGPDYFKAGAKQMRTYNPEVAIKLLQVALDIKPDSVEIAQRLSQWKTITADLSAEAVPEQTTQASEPGGDGLE